MSRQHNPINSKCDDKQGSLYSYLKSYKPIVFQQYRDNTPRSTYKSDVHNLMKINQNRRRSCYCSECGTQSQFQFKTQHIPLYREKVRPTFKKQQIAISQTQSSLNADEFSPQFEDSPILKKSSVLSSRRQSRFAHHCRFRQSIILANSEEKLQLIAEQKQKKSSLFNLDQLNTFKISSKPQSPIRKISQPTKPLLENYSLKSLTQRSPIYRETIIAQNKKYQNVYLIPLFNKNQTKSEKQQISIKANSSLRKRHCISQI
ncbi:unnamed protein product [Paramecium pentaurelia]|uniref:Uncharacterized protein n=1 Tax=Paramecium pentaurelia TaxID=43138 RepID=A0A8S1U577_9CILI|nr:unnamed protein product [Paramecium pentaurelia]